MFNPLLKAGAKLKEMRANGKVYWLAILDWSCQIAKKNPKALSGKAP
jgi:hypothetical protein